MNQRYINGPAEKSIPLFARLLLLFVLSAVNLQVHALGLGNPVVNSRLGQPLDVTAPLMLESGEELKLNEATVRVGSAQLFKRLELPYRAAYMEIESVVEKVNDGYRIRLFTKRSFVEPFIELPLDIHVAGNRLVRVVTLLVDPPVEAADAGGVKPRKPTVVTVPASSTGGEAGVAIVPSLKGNRYGPVATNDTLGDVATLMRYKGVTFNQKLVALWRANPDAFLHNNMNYLMVGSTLQLPKHEEVMSYPVKLANAEVAAQAKGRSGGSVIAARNMAEESQSRTQLEQTVPSGPGEDKGQAAKEQRLVIASPKSLDEMPPAVRGQFDALYSEIDAMQKENDHLRGRIANLEEQVAVMSRLVLEKETAKRNRGAAPAKDNAEEAVGSPVKEASKPATPRVVQVKTLAAKSEARSSAGMAQETVIYLLVALFFIIGGALVGWWLWSRREQTMSVQRLLR